MDKIAKIKEWLKPYLEKDKVRDEHEEGFFHCAMLLNEFIGTLSEELDKSLEEAEFEYAQSLNEMPANQEEEKMIYDAFIAGAEWQKERMGEQARKELAKTDITLADLVAFDEGLQLGRRLERQDMLKDAVEGEVYEFGEVIYVKERNNAELTKYLSQFNNGDKVRIVVLKDEEE